MGRPATLILSVAMLLCIATGAATGNRMIEPNAARERAEEALRASIAAADPLFAAWRGLAAAPPRLVEDLSGEPAYWVVPLLSGSHAVGFARVHPDGTVAAIGITCRTPETPALCPTPVFALSAQMVGDRVRADVQIGPDETLVPPRLVHDGPPGREAWLTESRVGDRAHRWIFTGPGGSYVRTAGTIPGGDSGGERE